MIPTDSKERKDAPVYSGCMAYFPDALVEVARLSKRGNDKHNPGEPLHWSREKSSDHGDCIARHQLEFDSKDEDGFYHAVNVAWRALAQLQLLLEAEEAPTTTTTVRPGEWVQVSDDWWKEAGGYTQEYLPGDRLDDAVSDWACVNALLNPDMRFCFWLGDKS